VSETGADTSFEGEFGAGIAFAPYGDLAATCIQLLQNPAGRREVAEAGFGRFKAMPQSDYLRQALAAARV
jgi:hypothetical protein